jgi:hypothetical protein
MFGAVANVEFCRGPGGHNIACGIAHIKSCHGKRRGIEVVIAVIKLCMGYPVHQAGQFWNGVIGLVGVSHMALGAFHCDIKAQGAPAADLDPVAQFFGGARFAHKAMVGNMAVCLHPLQNLHGAVDGGTFLVAGNQK